MPPALVSHVLAPTCLAVLLTAAATCWHRGIRVPLGARAPIGDSSLPAVMVFHLVSQGITKHHTLHCYSCVILFLRLVPHLPATQRRLHLPLRDRPPATIAHTLEGLPDSPT